MCNTRNILLAAAVFTITLCIAGCGGATHPRAITSHPQTTPTPAPAPASGEASSVASGETAAQVGAVAITTGQVNAWMVALFGGDYYNLTNQTAPNGLLSSPPGYSSCITAIKAIRKGQPSQSTAELKHQCQQLYQAVKQQAVTHFIAEQTGIDIAAELGITVTNSEGTQQLEQQKAAHYPKPGEFERYLASKHWTTAIELATLKEGLLGAKLLPLYTTTSNKPAFLARYKQAKEKWLAKTTCHTGYIVEGCKQYTPTTTPNPSPNQLIETITLPTPKPPKAQDLNCKNTTTGLNCQPINPIHKPTH